MRQAGAVFRTLSGCASSGINFGSPNSRFLIQPGLKIPYWGPSIISIDPNTT